MAGWTKFSSIFSPLWEDKEFATDDIDVPTDILIDHLLLEQPLNYLLKA